MSIISTINSDSTISITSTNTIDSTFSIISTNNTDCTISVIIISSGYLCIITDCSCMVLFVLKTYIKCISVWTRLFCVCSVLA